MNIFLFEDNQEDIDRLKTTICGNYDLIVANTIEDSLEMINNVSFDIAILDIFIDGMPKGINLANSINALIPKKPIIFLTSSMDRTVFECAKYTEPSSYLIKPFNPLELQYAIELAFEEFTRQPAAFATTNGVILQDYIFVKSDKIISKVNIKEVIYVETDANYCNLVTADQKYLIKVSLQKLLDQTLKPLFIQVHRSYVVNIDMIEHIYLQDNLVIMENGEKITLSHRFKSQILKTMNLFK
ncbi:LytTR family DNA-binding domain-containing protein [Flavivirga sp. 57AJ16]|uniref:LytR/AlgR family response regulator transcription factor n=1 Tax=Flavivirga sp. 57AJ16 TaxID=3025307 RepID=UPI0023664FEE|nr:LytTR family DNA-binding domain-containing protein [Flavivirga sp. 57AJ16]MDD7886900.1 LytTR family DNA-binding domain-containing protein [Flavivirga sp. 57AJ16]